MCLPRLESLFSQSCEKFCNQIPLAFKVRFPRDSWSLCWILRLGSLTGGAEPSQEWENFFGIVLQSVSHPPGGCRIWFYLDCTPPTISLPLLLCLWMCGFFFVFGCVVSSSSLDVWFLLHLLMCGFFFVFGCVVSSSYLDVWFLLCLWICGFFFIFGCVVSSSAGFQHPFVTCCLTASCNFGVLAGGDEHMSCYSAILNWKPHS